MKSAPTRRRTPAMRGLGVPDRRRGRPRRDARSASPKARIRCRDRSRVPKPTTRSTRRSFVRAPPLRQRAESIVAKTVDRHVSGSGMEMRRRTAGASPSCRCATSLHTQCEAPGVDRRPAPSTTSGRARGAWPRDRHSQPHIRHVRRDAPADEPPRRRGRRGDAFPVSPAEDHFRVSTRRDGFVTRRCDPAPTLGRGRRARLPFAITAPIRQM